MRLNIIAIGDELLAGQVIDTNSSFISRSLTPFGWQLNEVRVVGDKENDIVGEIERAMSETDVVVTTGGLGPTKDDITKGSLMKIFGGSLRHDEAVERNVREIFEKRDLQMNELTSGQWMVPDSSKVIMNRFGTAPVLWFEKNGKVLVALPGVPFEMKGCWNEEVLPKLLEKFPSDSIVLRKTLVVTGISESSLAEFLSGYEDALPQNIHLAYLPNSGYIRLRLDGISDLSGEFERIYEEYFETLKVLVGEWLLWDVDLTPMEMISKELKRLNLTISTAESCTGGRIASAITSLQGSSLIFKGGVVAYSNYVKSSVLGVPEDIIKNNGAVSLPVVKMMAEGVSRITGSDCSLATSGIAGPDGGTPEKPVGTVCIGVKSNDKTVTQKLVFGGRRERVMECAVNTSLIMLYKLLPKLQE